MVEANPDSTNYKAIGIDLGTTNSAVAVVRPNVGGEANVETIQNEKGNRTTPSMIAYDNKGKVQVGEAAKNLAKRVPDKCLYDAKRFIGKKVSDADYDRIREREAFWPFQIGIHKRTQKPKYIWKDKNNVEKDERPEYVSKYVLEKMREAARVRLDDGVDNSRKCVVTIPAYFSEA